jgi:hypothetical protein
MARPLDLSVRRDNTHVWEGVAERRIGRTVTTVDLTGATLTLTVVEQKGGAAILTKTSAPSGGIVIDPDQVANEGAYVLRIEAEDTADPEVWPEDEPRTYPYELELVDAAGDVSTLAYGSVKYTPDVT